MFIMVIQNMLCMILLSKGEPTKFINDYSLNLCIFFTNLALHFSCLATIRNGVTICKFAVYNHTELDNPIATFILGLVVVQTNVLCAITNMVFSLAQTNVVSVIQKFVAYKVLIQIIDYYTRSRANFEIKGSVVRNPVKINNDDRELLNSKISISIRIMYYMYKVLRSMFTSIYFYFFPLFVVYLPMQRLMFGYYID
mmetsp:Transcript_9819/g.16534  ORF Transcript_9819/g.16534 Transcript_9819/m.16534 type:complete len:197 (-) Transcript_9819:20-610(-)